MDTTNLQAARVNIAPKYDAYLVQLANGEMLLAANCVRMVTGGYELTNPVRLIVQQDGRGAIQVGFSPMLPFMQKDVQNFKKLEISGSQVLYKALLSEVLNDGERMARGYHQEVSGIALG